MSEVVLEPFKVVGSSKGEYKEPWVRGGWLGVKVPLTIRPWRESKTEDNLECFYPTMSYVRRHRPRKTKHVVGITMCVLIK